MKENNATLINLEYKWFVFDTEHDIICAGNEYRDDAIDVMDEANELMPCYRVYSAKYLISKDINPYDINNWGNFGW